MGSTQNNWPHVINVSNSIIGITILAMPFCFQLCGVILGSVLLLLSTWMTLVSCHLLMKAGVTSRRKSYSFLAYHTHGAIGKLLVEIGMIGLQLGTLVAQVVIIGDLGPAIVSKFTGFANTEDLRTGLIVALCLLVGLPLGLLKDVRALSKTSTLCIIFYASFAVYVITQSFSNLWLGGWYHKINFWRTDGLFQCLPIFSFAFGCQTQLFIVYDSLTEPSLKRINSIVSLAVSMCTVAYLLVGFFGYIAFCTIDEISGDIVNHFQENMFSDIIKLCFVFSISVSIPLIVFPCRMSLYTLLFPQKPKEDVPVSGKIPEFEFKIITICIIVGSMVIGILVPNVEFVLGISGATMGTLICFIFPALFYINVMSESAENKWTGRLLLVFGLTIMVCSTYVTITKENLDHRPIRIDIDTANQNADLRNIVQLEDKNEAFIDEHAGGGFDPVHGNNSKRQEPPNPLAPASPEEVKKDKEEYKDGNVVGKINADKSGVRDMIDVKEEGKQDEIDLSKKKNRDKLQGENILNDKIAGEKRDNPVEVEVLLQESERKQDQILDKLEQQQVEQQKLIEAQKEILEELKQHKEEHKEDSKAAIDGVHQVKQVQLVQEQAGAGDQIAARQGQLPMDSVHEPVNQQQQALGHRQDNQVQESVNNIAQGQAFQQPVQAQNIEAVLEQAVQQPVIGAKQPLESQGHINIKEPIIDQDQQRKLKVQDTQQVQGQVLLPPGKDQVLLQPVQNQVLQQPVQNQVLQQPIQGQVLQQPVQHQVLQQLGQGQDAQQVAHGQVLQPVPGLDPQQAPQGQEIKLVPQENIVKDPLQIDGAVIIDKNINIPPVHDKNV